MTTGVSNVFRLDSIIFPSTDILQVQRASWDPGITDMLERGAGGVRPKFAGIEKQEAELKFTSSQIDGVLGDATLMTGFAIGSALTGYFKKMGQTGPVARATTSHTKGVINYGYAYVERITLESNGQSTVDVTLCAGFDGTNDPIVFTGSVTLDATDIVSDYHFVAGPVAINGSALAGIQKVVLETGIKVEKLYGGGDVWPTFIGIKTTEPKITITTLEVAPQVTTGLDGIALDGTNGVVFYARKCTNAQAGGVARVADATTEHIKFVALNGHYHCNPSGDGDNPINNEIVIMPVTTADGTVEIAATVSSAIT